MDCFKQHIILNQLCNLLTHSPPHNRTNSMYLMLCLFVSFFLKSERERGRKGGERGVDREGEGGWRERGRGGMERERERGDGEREREKERERERERERASQLTQPEDRLVDIKRVFHVTIHQPWSVHKGYKAELFLLGGGDLCCQVIEHTWKYRWNEK